MSRPLPPPLEFATPPCSICGKSTEYEDGSFYCYDCLACWPSEGAPEGEWYEDPGRLLDQCPSVMRPWADSVIYQRLRDRSYRCVLDAGHLEGERGTDRHRHPEWSEGWTDKQADAGMADATAGGAQ